uniref:Casein kinase II subunit beta n=1 Tax=Parastrongyloides trichosuri TaxID=131310 RepID=A0A0N4ZDI7_PARTI
MTEQTVSWVKWFCSRNGHDFFCEVDENFMQDQFNLTELPEQVPYFSYAWALILDELDEEEREFQMNLAEESAEILYGLIHARYILTSAGIDLMVKKYQKKEFGVCPRTLCDDQAVLPIGLSDIYGEGSVKIYCPRCCEIFHPPNSKYDNVDGAFFGTGFPHMLFLAYPNLLPKHPAIPYQPRLYGFKVHSSFYDNNNKKSHKKKPKHYR